VSRQLRTNPRAFSFVVSSVIASCRPKQADPRASLADDDRQ
jgi:hypothetical protein